MAAVVLVLNVVASVALDPFAVREPSAAVEFVELAVAIAAASVAIAAVVVAAVRKLVDQQLQPFVGIVVVVSDVE